MQFKSTCRTKIISPFSSPIYNEFPYLLSTFNKHIILVCNLFHFVSLRKDSKFYKYFFVLVLSCSAYNFQDYVPWIHTLVIVRHLIHTYPGGCRSSQDINQTKMELVLRYLGPESVDFKNVHLSLRWLDLLNFTVSKTKPKLS